MLKKSSFTGGGGWEEVELLGTLLEVLVAHKKKQ